MPKKLNTNKHPAFLLVFLILLFGTISIILIAALWNQINKPNWVSASVASRCSINSNSFEKSWHLADVYISHQREGNIYLDGEGNYAYFLGSTSPNEYESLIKLNIQNGEFVWESIQNQSFLDENPSTLATSNNFIYVGFNSHNKVSGDTQDGASEIVAYNTLDGTEIWKARVGGARNITTIVATNSFINVDGSYSSDYYTFDPRNGELLETRDKLEGYKIFDNGNIVYERHFTSELKAIEQSSGNKIWTNDLPGYIRRPPIFTEEIILIRTGDSLGKVIALDENSGGILWELGNIVSNIAVDGTNVYLLNKNAELLTINLESGNIQTRLKMGQSSLKDVLNFGYYLTANNGTTLLYFGDSRELCAVQQVSQ